MVSAMDTPAIEAVLQENLIGRIGCSHDGFTYVVPISYAYEDNCVYGHTSDGLKLDIMRKNPEVCFQVDNTKDLNNWKSVISWGTFRELTQSQEKQFALQKLSGRKIPSPFATATNLGLEWPFTSSAGQAEEVGGIFFCIELHDKFGRQQNINSRDTSRTGK